MISLASSNSRDTGPEGLADVNPVRPQPLVGRREQVDAAVGALRGGSTGAILIVAESGLGKSAMAEAIAATLSGDMIVMRVHGSPSLSNVPYGVLAPYLVDLPEDPTNSQIAILRAFWAQFERLRAGRDLPLLLVVDDAHELDQATANVIVDLITANWAKVVASCRPRPGLPASMMQLWYDSMAERFELEPLSREDINEIVEQSLGAPVLPSTVHTLWAASEGNPMLLNCLIKDARKDGVLAPHDGVWLLSEPLTADGPALTGVVRNQLLRRTPQEREALNMIALAEPVSLDALESTVGPDMVQELVESQLLAVDSDGEPQVRLRHPVFGEAIRSMVSASRSLQLRQQLISHLDREPASPESMLRMVRWSLEAGVSVPDKQLLRAALHAARTFRNVTAISLAARIRDVGLRQLAREPAARAQFNIGQYAEAARALDGGSHSPKTIGPTAGTVLLQVSVGLGTGQVPPVPELSALQGAAHSKEHTHEAVLGLYAMDLAGDFSLLAEALDELEPALLSADGRASGALRAFLLAMRADVRRAFGDPTGASAPAEQALAFAASDADELFFFPEFLLYRRAVAALDAGEWQEAERILGSYEAEAGPGLMSFGGTVQYLRGLSLLRQGRFDQAFRVLRPAVEALRLNDPQQLLAAAEGAAAYAAARSGDGQQAQKLLDQVSEPGRQETGPDAALAGIFATAARETISRNGAGLAELQDMLSAESGVLPAPAELQALSVLLEMSGTALPRLAELTSVMTGRWAKAWNLYAGSLSATEAAACLDAGETIHGLGMVRLARDCFARAAGLFEAAGDRLGARQALAQRDHCERELGEQPGTESEPPPAPSVLLTRREKDIIALAVEGLTDRQIADRLMVSVRTVEGHLYRSYAKLGIRSREELHSAAGL